MVTCLPYHVLLVEDNPGDAWIVRHLFAQIAGASVEIDLVTDGEAALAYLRHERPGEGDAAPDLVLLDLNLPRKDGRQVLREIRADPMLHHLPVVVLSSSDAAGDIRDCRALQADGYLVKQPDLDDQADALRALQRRWLRGPP